MIPLWALGAIGIGAWLLTREKVSDAGIAFIKKIESFEATPYLDESGQPHIGYGHLIQPGESFTRISPAEATRLLYQDLAPKMYALMDSVDRPLTQGQVDALLSFIYNVGIESFKNSDLLELLNEKRDFEAGQEFSKWIYYTPPGGGKKLQSKGLIQRRKLEQQQFYS